MSIPVRADRPVPSPFLRATVADVMTEGLISCAPSTPLRSVARLMASHRVHSVFVFDYGQEDDEVDLDGDGDGDGDESNAGEDSAAGEEGQEEQVDLEALTRSELNELATQLGVGEPDKLANKDTVIDAIRAAFGPNGNRGAAAISDESAPGEKELTTVRDRQD